MCSKRSINEIINAYSVLSKDKKFNEIFDKLNSIIDELDKQNIDIQKQIRKIPKR
jgi:hypothetical protein